MSGAFNRYELAIADSTTTVAEWKDIARSLEDAADATQYACPPAGRGTLTERTREKNERAIKLRDRAADCRARAARMEAAQIVRVVEDGTKGIGAVILARRAEWDRDMKTLEVVECQRRDEADDPVGIVLVRTAAGRWGVGEYVRDFDEAGPRGRGWKVADAVWNKGPGAEDAARADYLEAVSP